MPTDKRRINLTLDDEMIDLLARHRATLSKGKFVSIAGAAIDLIRRGAEVYYGDAWLTIAANADNLPADKRGLRIESGARKGIDKYWGDENDRDRKT